MKKFMLGQRGKTITNGFAEIFWLRFQKRMDTDTILRTLIQGNLMKSPTIPSAGLR